MPRYYCDYCDAYLTHDSPVVRKQHNSGYKHKANVKAYYSQFEEAEHAALIERQIADYHNRMGMPPARFMGPPQPGMPPPRGGPGPMPYPPRPGMGPPPPYGQRRDRRVMLARRSLLPVVP
eukprot:scaffold11.g4062.t1